MRKLRRAPTPGRAAVVVPNGTLSGDGVCARIKQHLLTEYNLHTIVRLPIGVFEPYTKIPTNILFFDRSVPTEHVWYYEQIFPEGKKNYTKTAPVQFEDFADCLAWWHNRAENERAWRVPAATILANDCNLDIKNPHAKEDFAHLPPEQVADGILGKGQQMAGLMSEIKQALADAALEPRAEYPKVQLGDILEPISRPESVDPEKTYRILGARWYANGLYIKDVRTGAQIQANKVYRVDEGDFVYNRLFAWKGSFALATAENDGCYVSNEFPCFAVDQDRVLGSYLWHYFSQPTSWEEVFGLSTGGTPTSRNRLKEDKLLAMYVPLPPLEDQVRIVRRIDQVSFVRQLQNEITAELDTLLLAVLHRAFRGEL